jgi:hypothetical protein
MKDLQLAILEEKAYLSDRSNGINTSLPGRLKQFGYDTLDEYFNDKREYLFNEWRPEIYPIDVRAITTDLEDAVRNEKYGVYISTAEGLYAFHGSDDIDYELCDELGIAVAEVYHMGGTIIGGVDDFGIEIVAPLELGLQPSQLLSKFYDIISRYETDVELVGNDILVNGEKVLGSMHRLVGNVFVWAAQVSFEEHDEVIKKICNKKSKKKPGRIKHATLNKKTLEREVLRWLRKQ